MKRLFILGFTFLLTQTTLLAADCDNCIKPFVVPTGVDLEQYSDVLKFLDGSQNKLAPSEREYWKLRQELSEVSLKLIRGLADNERKIASKIYQIVSSESGMNTNNFDKLTSKDYSPIAMQKIKNRFSKIDPIDPFDSSLKALKSKADEIQHRLATLNKQIQDESKKNLKKAEFYDAQSLYDEVSELSFKQQVLNFQKRPLSLIGIFSRNNVDGPTIRVADSTKEFKDVLPKLEAIAEYENITVLQFLAGTYAGAKLRDDMILPEYNETKARRYGTILAEKYSHGIGHLALAYTEREDEAIKHYIVYTKSRDFANGIILSEKEMREWYPTVNHSRYLKSGLVKP